MDKVIISYLFMQYKGTFSREPYIDLAQSRSHRDYLARLRISASRVEVEIMRYQKNPPPRTERVCSYCGSGDVGDERHLLMFCKTFESQTTVLLVKCLPFVMTL